MLKPLHHFLYRTAIVWKMALASGLSWWLAKLAGSSHPYLAPLSVILTLQVTVDKSIKYGLQRVLGTIAGVLLTVFLLPYIGINAWSLTLLIFIASAFVHGLGFSKIVINQVTLSILLVLSFESHPDYGVDRIRDTLIGCILAVLINMFIFPPDFTEKATKECEHYKQELINGFNMIGGWLEKQWATNSEEPLTQTIDGVWKELAKTMTQYEKAEQSLRYHPFVEESHENLHQIQTSLKKLNHGFSHLNNIIETLFEWEKEQTISSEERMFWAKRMRDIARHLEDYDQTIEGGEQESTTLTPFKEAVKNWTTFMKLPALTQAYRFAYSLQNDVIQLSRLFS